MIVDHIKDFLYCFRDKDSAFSYALERWNNSPAWHKPHAVFEAEVNDLKPIHKIAYPDYIMDYWLTPQEKRDSEDYLIIDAPQGTYLTSHLTLIREIYRTQ